MSCRCVVRRVDWHAPCLTEDNSVYSCEGEYQRPFKSPHDLNLIGGQYYEDGSTYEFCFRRGTVGMRD